jgi:hypothetical protein
LTLVVLLSCSKQLISPTKLISPPMIIPSVSLFRMEPPLFFVLVY